MPSFREFLVEAKGAGFAPWHIRDPEEIKRALEVTQGVSAWGPCLALGYEIMKNGAMNLKTDQTTMPVRGLGNIPDGYGFLFKYQTIEMWHYKLNDDKITNLWGFADRVKGHVEINSHSLKSLDHLITKISQDFEFKLPHLEDWGNCFVQCDILRINDMGKSLGFKDISKHFTAKDRIVLDKNGLDKMTNKGLLGFCKTKSGTGIPNRVWHKDSVAGSNELSKILNTYNSNKDDLLDCQEALIANGYKEYAKL